MVAKKEGGVTNQNKPDAYGIHDNPVSGSHPLCTVTLTSQWKHKYLPQSYHDKMEGRAGNKSTVQTIRQH